MRRSALASLIWVIVLLVTTISSPTRQGFHDRFANSAVVQPVGTGSGVVLLGCLLLIALWILGSIVALIFLGSQVSTILSTVGDSVYP